MPNFNNLKLDALRERCRTAGLPTSGKRKELIERLNYRYGEEQFENSQKVPESSLVHRIKMLEKALDEVRNAKIVSTTMSSSNQSVVLDEVMQQSHSQLPMTNETTPVSAKNVTFIPNAQEEQQQLSLDGDNSLNLHVPNEQAYARQASHPTPNATTRNTPLQRFSQPTPIAATTRNMPLQQFSQPTPNFAETRNMPLQQFSQPTPNFAETRNMPLQQFSQPTPNFAETRKMPLQHCSQPTIVSSTICNVPYQQTSRYTAPQTVYMSPQVSAFTNACQQPAMTTNVYEHRNPVTTSSDNYIHEERNMQEKVFFNSADLNVPQQQQQNFDRPHMNYGAPLYPHNVTQRHASVTGDQNRRYGNDVNFYSDIRDVITLLPVFDPSSEKSLGARQFIQRV